MEEKTLASVTFSERLLHQLSCFCEYTKGNKMNDSCMLEDMSHIIGVNDNTIVRSVVNKLIRLKSDFYNKPKVIFEDKKECYRITLIWDDEVAFTYSDDINPIVNMIENRLNDVAFSPLNTEGKISTAISFDIIKEAHLHAVPCLTKRKREGAHAKLPSLNTMTNNLSVQKEFFKKRRTKSSENKKSLTSSKEKKVVGTKE